jgi:hypothetical protein
VADIGSWLKTEWFSLIQTAGVIGGLIFTGLTVRQEARARETQNLLAFAERHRLLWGEVGYRPELHRLIAKDADLVAKPITPAEEATLKVVLVHFELGWRLAKSMDRSDLDPLAKDIREFFSRPLPRAAWQTDKGCHNREFVRFVSRAIEPRGRY